MELYRADEQIITFFRRISMPAARIAIFVIFFWFGILKVLDLSPAGPLVTALYNKTLFFLPFHPFYICFGLFECFIGILFIIKGLERLAIPFLFLHMVTTMLPLIMLPDLIWAQPFVPTLEGQYIIKNLVVIAVAIGIAAHLHPLKRIEATQFS
jgi:uncharacterized membrane protein YkgB